MPVPVGVRVFMCLFVVIGVMTMIAAWRNPEGNVSDLPKFLLGGGLWDSIKRVCKFKKHQVTYSQETRSFFYQLDSSNRSLQRFVKAKHKIAEDIRMINGGD